MYHCQPWQVPHALLSNLQCTTASPGRSLMHCSQTCSVPLPALAGPSCIALKPAVYYCQPWQVPHALLSNLQCTTASPGRSLMHCSQTCSVLLPALAGPSCIALKPAVYYCQPWQVPHALLSNLQCTTVGPGRSLICFLACRMKLSAGCVVTGTPWSGHDVNQK